MGPLAPGHSKNSAEAGNREGSAAGPQLLRTEVGRSLLVLPNTPHPAGTRPGRLLSHSELGTRRCKACNVLADDLETGSRKRVSGRLLWLR